MADTKVTGLTADTSPSLTDVIATVKDPGGSPLNRKVELTNLQKALGCDMLAKLVNTEVSVTEAGTATIGKQHICSGTTYTETLPTVSGNAGKFISFRMSNALTGIVTIAADGSEKIWTPRGEVASRKYVAGEMCVLYCDGTQWHLVLETMQSIIFSAYQTNVQVIPTGTDTKVAIDTEWYDSHETFDSTTNYRLTPTAPGVYNVTGACSISNLDAAKGFEVGILKNGSDWRLLVSTKLGAVGNPVASGSLEFSMNGTTDYLELYVFHANGTARNTQVAVEYRPRFQGYRVCREES